MNELNEEIKLTLNLMQTDIHEVSLNELQYHLNGLLAMKRNELQQRMVERSWLDHADGMGVVVKFDQAPYKSVKLDGQITDEAKPLTAEELKAGGWCVDSSEECLKALIEKGLVERDTDWMFGGGYKYCNMGGSIVVMRTMQAHNAALKRIHLVGNEFYWSDDET